jgi:hypothetical protein
MFCYENPKTRLMLMAFKLEEAKEKKRKSPSKQKRQEEIL